jgi:hypothetical protein
MKKTFLCFAAMFILFAADAQRKMTQIEIDYYNNLYKNLYASIPHTYRGWDSTNDAQNFDARNALCSTGSNCNGSIKFDIGVTEPYSLTLSSSFTMPGDDQAKLKHRLLDRKWEPSEAAILARAEAVAELEISIRNNSTDDFELVYCPESMLETLSVPIKTALAVKCNRAPCPVGDTTGKHLYVDANYYYDRAIIILGKTIAKKIDGKKENGLLFTKYSPAFDNAKIGKAITQNIVIEIKGSPAEIDAAIQAINWQKLSGMIGK